MESSIVTLCLWVVFNQKKPDDWFLNGIVAVLVSIMLSTVMGVLHKIGAQGALYG